MFGKRKYLPKFHPLKILFFIAVALTVFSLVSYLVMWLWNTILVDVTNVKPLGFWQAAGLLILARILFGGIMGRGKRHHKRRKHWREKWMNMSEEERMEFKSKWKDRCKTRGKDEI